MLKEGCAHDIDKQSVFLYIYILMMEVASVSQSAYEYIKRKILSGEYKPGEKLEERRIADELNISRPPMREAFRSLEHNHLILNKPRRGNFVTEASLEQFKDLYEARLLAESGAIDILEKKNIREIPEIGQTLVELPDNVISTDKPLEEQLHIIFKLNEFHTKIVEATRNGWLVNFYHSITLSVCRYTFFYRAEIKYTVKDHDEIYQAIQEGRYADAKKLVETHVEQYTKSPYTDLIEQYSR